MEFLYYLLFWSILGGVLIFLVNKLVSTNPKRKLKKAAKKRVIDNYGGPELELPPGIVLQEDDGEVPAQNLKSRS